MNSLQNLGLPTVVTTDATPTSTVLQSISADGAIAGFFLVHAFCPATGEAAAFSAVVGGKRTGGGNLALVGSVVSLMANKDSGASTWTANIAGSNGSPAIVVTGQAGKTITWGIFGLTGIVRG